MVTNAEIRESLSAIGERLAEARAAVGMDQAELSRRSEVSRVMISDFERATRTMSLEHLLRLADGAGIRVEWLLTGRGEMRSGGISLEEIQYQARQGRKQEYTFTATINRMVLLYGHDPLRMTWALGSCIRAYWGVPWLGFANLQEVAQVVVAVADQLNLDLVEVLEATGHLNATQGVADWLLHRGIDSRAFHADWDAAHTSYEVRYDPDGAKPMEELLQIARQKGLVVEESTPSPARRTLVDFLRGLRIFDPGTKET